MDLDLLLARLAAQIPDGAGPVGLLSGDEFLPPAAPFDRALIDLAGPRIGLVLCAGHASAPQSEAFARAHFANLGATIVTADLIHGDADDCDILYIAGGSPPELLGCLRGARWDAMLARWRAGAALVGSSAGAMALCTTCLTPRPGDMVPTVWSDGAGPLDGVALAVHASSRPRAWIDEVARTAPVPLLAIDDHTGVLLTNGDAPRVIGDGRVWLATS